MIEIDFKAFTVGCVLGVIISSLIIWLLMFISEDEIFIVRDGVIGSYFTAIFLVIVNCWAAIGMPPKDYQSYRETGFKEIHNDYKKLIGFYPYFSAFIALLCVLSMIIHAGATRGDTGFLALQLLASSALIVMSVGLAYGCSKGIIKDMEKRQIEYLQDYLDEMKKKD